MVNGFTFVDSENSSHPRQKPQVNGGTDADFKRLPGTLLQFSAVAMNLSSLEWERSTIYWKPPALERRLDLEEWTYITRLRDPNGFTCGCLYGPLPDPLPQNLKIVAISVLRYNPMLPYLRYREKDPICLDDHGGIDKDDYEHSSRSINCVFDAKTYQMRDFCTVNVLLASDLRNASADGLRVVERIGMGHEHIDALKEFGGVEEKIFLA
jgi:hypothetical protein